MKTIEARLKISAVDRTGYVLKNVGERLQHVNQKAAAMNKTMAMASMVRAGTAVFTAMGAAAAYSVKQAATFEEALFGIQKKSGATAEQMAKIGQEIKGLATEIPVSMEEIASAFERGAAAGIPVDELREFAKLSAGVADAWDTTAENVGNIFAGFSVGLGIARKDLQGFASLINDLADSGIADETGIADFLDRAGASLKNFGMSPEQIAAYGAAMLNLKIPAETAARALDSVTGKLLAPENLSPKARTALTDVVGDLGKFSKLAGDQKLSTFLRNIERLSPQRRASLLGAFVGDEFDDEIMRLVAGTKELQRNLELAQKHIANPSNSIADAMTKKLDLLNSQLKITKGHFEAITTELGERMLPFVTSEVRKLNEMMEQSRNIQKAREGMSPEERRQDFDWFKERFGEIDPANKGKLGLAAKRYQEGQERVGRGEFKDIYDYVESLKQRERYINQQVAPSRGGRQRQAVNFYSGPEFPGGDSHLDPFNLPSSGVPVPADRNAPSSEERRRLKEQLAMYNAGRSGLRDGGQSMTREQRGALLRNADPAALGMGGMGGVLIESSRQAGEAVASGGEVAGQKIADGSREGAGELMRAVEALRGVFSMAGAVADRLERATKAGGTMGGLANPRPSVNADTGRSMPPSTFGPR